VLTRDDALDARPLVLVVPDGSWSQARKIARRDPLAQGAEHVTLPPGAPSRYGLRRSPRAGGLCTLEAIARALGILEGGEVEPALLAVLETFVARHRAIGRRGPLC
jgi:DTW domain-containing protein YfiP